MEWNAERAVILTHSYGAIVTSETLSAIETTDPGWMSRYIEAVVEIAGATLGVPKAVSALLSGEVRDTAQLPGVCHVAWSITFS